MVQSYLSASQRLLAQGREELTRGDVQQASEKGWGAAAQIVKSVAEQRGWEHRSHAALFNAVSLLVSETGDAEIRRLFHVASALHVNFYEDWDNAENVASGLDDVERFVNKLEPLTAIA